METLWLSRPCADVPWGFRLQGGADFATPLSIQRVSKKKNRFHTNNHLLPSFTFYLTKCQ